MELCRLFFLVSVFLPIICAEITYADSTRNQNDVVGRPEGAQLELHRLKSKISSLETSIENQTGELKRKDGGIKQLERIIEEKSNSLVSFRSAVGSFQEKPLEVNERIGQIDTHVYELEKQIVNLKNEIGAQNKRKEELEARANVAERKIVGLNLKLENLRKVNDEQKLIISTTQLALEVAEEEMLKARLKAYSTMEELKQSFVLTHWKEIGRLAFDLTIPKKWSPSIREQYTAIVDDLHPQIQSLSTQVIDYYHVVWGTIEPHVVKIQETIDPYFQAAKIFMNPCIDLFKPYSIKLVSFHREIVKNVQVYHSLVQETLHETLNSYESTKPLAVKGLVRVLASIVMVLPLIVLFRIVIPKEEKEKKSRSRHSNSRSYARQRARRLHQDR